MLSYKRINSSIEMWITIVIFSAYAFGTVTTQHYLPSQIDFLPNITVIGLLCSGLIVLLTRIKIEKIGLDSIFWLLLFILILVQPFFIDYAYLDGVLFPLATILVCFILSAIINNIDNKSKLIYHSAFGFTLVALFSTVFQLLQYANVSDDLWFVMTMQGSRFFGNVGQPNQLAFIYALGIVACHYLLIKAKYKRSIFIVTALVILSIGLALTSSRGGLILGLASFLIYGLNFKRTSNIKIVLSSISMSIIGFLVGSYLLTVHNLYSKDTLSRFATGDNAARVELIQQAWVQFLYHPLMGVGFGNLLADSLEHIEQVDWFVFNIHSHNIIMQFAAELGVLGLGILLVAAFTVMRSYWQSRNLESSFIFVAIIIVALYSLSEYPLWYTRYLIIAVFLLAAVNRKTIKINLDLNKLFVTVAALCIIGSIFYYHFYKEYHRVNTYLNYYKSIDSNKLNKNEQQEITQIQQQMLMELPSVFGFSDYKEFFIYHLLPKDNSDLEERINLGNRVLTKFLTHNILLKQALYFGLNNQPKQALHLYQGACLLDHSERCNMVSLHVNELADNYKQFEGIRQDYNKWVKANQSRIIK
ncbi:Wzy polymerase domain-containing protein [Psychrobacter sp. ER1]|uniref:PglL family O-oligosaccharyltransferase n=1 Tax=Psychrobacter sp. ER1 TaxID=3406645 RepID=UPI003B433297